MTVRTTTSKGAVTRTRIVDAAAALFHENGVAATGLDEVLVVSEAGKSQLYHYFGGKSGLVDEVIDVQADRILAWHTDLLAGVDDVQGLRRWADTVVAAVADRAGAYGCPLGSLAAELSDRADGHRARVAGGFVRWEQVLVAAVARVIGAGAAADDAGARLLTVLQGGLLLAEATRGTRHLRIGFDAAIADVERLARASTPERRRPRRGSSR